MNCGLLALPIAPWRNVGKFPATHLFRGESFTFDGVI